MAQLARSGQGLGLLFIDIDGFKEINDVYGHETGDVMLKELADRMKRTMREGDTISRLGGDEFVAILLNVSDETESQSILLRLLKVCALPVVIEQQPLQVSASIGVTFYPQREEVSAERILNQADSAMYLAKQAGGGRYCIHK